MVDDKICKTVHQYNKKPISEADMEKLLEISLDCKKVKNYVYSRYGGIASLSKLYPGYTVQNEMTESGLRENLGMPSVYYYLAIFDALKDIRCQWTWTKSKLQRLITQNENFTEEEKHYLRFLIKVPNAFEAVLNQKSVDLPGELGKQYDLLASQADTGRMRRYLCRQVRKYHVRLHTDMAAGFPISERAYRYADHGIYISTKERRKRLFIPLTDNNQYKCQLYVRLYPEKNAIEIKAPVNVSVKRHEDYLNQVGLSVGIHTMLTTSEGHSYGKQFGNYQAEYAGWIRDQTIIYNRNRANNPGRKKYNAKKRRLEEQLHSYVNHELNQFLMSEKPCTIYIAKLPKPKVGGYSKKTNHLVAQWQRGYIRKRLIQKCKEQSIEIVEVFGKGISGECSNCGMPGEKKKGVFTCRSCGYSAEEKLNTARNVKKRGQGGGILHQS